MDLKDKLQRASEVFDILEQTLPLNLKGQFVKVQKDPHGFPDAKPIYGKLRIMPDNKNVPKTFWHQKWCFYVVGVGRIGADYKRFPLNIACDAHVMFQMPHGDKGCGKGQHEEAVEDVLTSAKNSLGTDWEFCSVPKKDGPKHFLVKPYLPAGNYPRDGHLPTASVLAQDLAALINATYPAFLK